MRRPCQLAEIFVFEHVIFLIHMLSMLRDFLNFQYQYLTAIFYYCKMGTAALYRV